jgi:hypothetical protein
MEYGAGTVSLASTRKQGPQSPSERVTPNKNRTNAPIGFSHCLSTITNKIGNAFDSLFSASVSDASAKTEHYTFSTKVIKVESCKKRTASHVIELTDKAQNTRSAELIGAARVNKRDHFVSILNTAKTKLEKLIDDMIVDATEESAKALIADINTVLTFLGKKDEAELNIVENAYVSYVLEKILVDLENISEETTAALNEFDEYVAPKRESNQEFQNAFQEYRTIFLRNRSRFNSEISHAQQTLEQSYKALALISDSRFAGEDVQQNNADKKLIKMQNSAIEQARIVRENLKKVQQEFKAAKNFNGIEQALNKVDKALVKFLRNAEKEQKDKFNYLSQKAEVASKERNSYHWLKQNLQPLADRAELGEKHLARERIINRLDEIYHPRFVVGYSNTTTVKGSGGIAGGIPKGLEAAFTVNGSYNVTYMVDDEGNIAKVVLGGIGASAKVQGELPGVLSGSASLGGELSGGTHTELRNSREFVTYFLAELVRHAEHCDDPEIAPFLSRSSLLAEYFKEDGLTQDYKLWAISRSEVDEIDQSKKKSDFLHDHHDMLHSLFLNPKAESSNEKRAAKETNIKTHTSELINVSTARGGTANVASHSYHAAGNVEIGTKSIASISGAAAYSHQHRVLEDSRSTPLCQFLADPFKSNTEKEKIKQGIAEQFELFKETLTKNWENDLSNVERCFDFLRKDFEAYQNIQVGIVNNGSATTQEEAVLRKMEARTRATNTNQMLHHMIVANNYWFAQVDQEIKSNSTITNNDLKDVRQVFSYVRQLKKLVKKIAETELKKLGLSKAFIKQLQEMPDKPTLAELKEIATAAPQLNRVNTITPNEQELIELLEEIGKQETNALLKKVTSPNSQKLVELHVAIYDFEQTLLNAPFNSDPNYLKQRACYQEKLDFEIIEDKIVAEVGITVVIGGASIKIEGIRRERKHTNELRDGLYDEVSFSVSGAIDDFNKAIGLVTEELNKKFPADLAQKIIGDLNIGFTNRVEVSFLRRYFKPHAFGGKLPYIRLIKNRESIDQLFQLGLGGTIPTGGLVNAVVDFSYSQSLSDSYFEEYSNDTFLYALMFGIHEYAVLYDDDVKRRKTLDGNENWEKIKRLQKSYFEQVFERLGKELRNPHSDEKPLTNELIAIATEVSVNDKLTYEERMAFTLASGDFNNAVKELNQLNTKINTDFEAAARSINHSNRQINIAFRNALSKKDDTDLEEALDAFYLTTRAAYINFKEKVKELKSSNTQTPVEFKKALDAFHQAVSEARFALKKATKTKGLREILDQSISHLKEAVDAFRSDLSTYAKSHEKTIISFEKWMLAFSPNWFEKRSNTRLLQKEKSYLPQLEISVLLATEESREVLDRRRWQAHYQSDFVYGGYDEIASMMQIAPSSIHALFDGYHFFAS